MRPTHAALLAGPFAVPGWLLGLALGGLARWVVEAIGGLLGLGWLGAPVEALVVLALPPALAGGAYALAAHGDLRAWDAGLAGVVAGALAGSAALVLGLLPLAPAVGLLALGGSVLGAAAAAAMQPRPPAAAA